MQEIFYEDDYVMCISVHRLAEAAGTAAQGKMCGAASEKGAGKGEGYNINLPWPAVCVVAHCPSFGFWGCCIALISIGLSGACLSSQWYL